MWAIGLLGSLCALLMTASFNPVSIPSYKHFMLLLGLLAAISTLSARSSHRVDGLS